VAFDVEVSQLELAELVAHGRVRRFADQDLPGGRDAREAGGDVDGVAERGEVADGLRADRAYVGGAGVDAGPDPPAPYEAILLLHDYLVQRGIRDSTQLRVVTPQPAPIPVSPEASRAVELAMAARGIAYVRSRRVYGIDPANKVAHFKDHDEPYDLFVGIPVHKVPDVLVAAGLTENGWVKVDPFTLATSFPGVFALGDCAETGIPKAGVFAESAAQAVADQITVLVRDGTARPYDGSGLCFIEMGNGEVGRVDVHFRAPGGPTAPLLGPSAQYAAEKAEFGAIRRARWFDL
jgi:sulfide:quinone oxidoreductase